MTVNCSATRAGLKDMKCEGENSSSKLLSSGVAKGQVHRSPAKNKGQFEMPFFSCSESQLFTSLVKLYLQAQPLTAADAGSVPAGYGLVSPSLIQRS